MSNGFERKDAITLPRWAWGIFAVLLGGFLFTALPGIIGGAAGFGESKGKTEQTMDGIARQLNEIKSSQDREFSELKDGLSELRTEVGVVVRGMAKAKTDIEHLQEVDDDLRDDVDDNRSRIEELRRQEQ